MTDGERDRSENYDRYRDTDANSEQLNILEAESNPTKDFLFFIYDLLKTGFVVFLIAFSLRYFAIQPFIVDGESMMPNFVNSEYLLAEKISYITGEPKRGDAVIFRYPGNTSVNYIKRIIALPGETIKISDNKVTIVNTQNPSGIVLDESKYLPPTSLTLSPESSAVEKTLQANEYFVMGDNRQHSSDSREWGALPKSNIIGRAWLTIMPLNRFGIEKRISYSDLSLLNIKRLLAFNNQINKDGSAR